MGKGCHHVCPSPTSVLLGGPALPLFPPVVLERALYCDSALHSPLSPNTTLGIIS